MEVDREVQRLRDWRHETDKTLWAIRLQIKQMAHDVSEITPEVHRLVDAERIAREVAKRIKSQNTLRLTYWQRIGAFIVGLAAVADTIARIKYH